MGRRTLQHPGEVLRDRFLAVNGLTQVELAKRIGTSFRTVNEIVRGRRVVTPGIAVRLAKLFGTSARFWLDLQSQFDAERATTAFSDTIARIRPIGEKGPTGSVIRLADPDTEPTEAQFRVILRDAMSDAKKKRADARKRFWDDVDKEIDAVLRDSRQLLSSR